jgi:hypothetical protein
MNLLLIGFIAGVLVGLGICFGYLELQDDG